MAWGQFLRNEREKQGYSLDMVEQETKIRKFYLEALENEEFASLPPKVYAIGFVRKYARLLNLNEDEMLEQYKQLAYGHEVIEEEIISSKEKIDTVNRIPWKNMTAGIVFLLVVIWLGSIIVPHLAERGTEDLTHRNTPNQQVSPEEVKPEPKPAESKTTAQVEIAAIQKCWLQVKVDGEIVYTGTIYSGQNKMFTGNNMVSVRAGNAGGVEITYNGDKQGVMGVPGTVVEKEYPASKQ